MEDYTVVIKTQTLAVVNANSEEEAKSVVFNRLVANKEIKPTDPIEINVIEKVSIV